MKKQNGEKQTNVRKGAEWYREEIIEMVNHVENLEYLQFIHNMMIAFKKKWGI